MTKFAKLAAVAAVAMMTAPAAMAAPVGVSGAKPEARVKIVRPLTLSATGAVDLGTVTLNGVTTDHVVSVSAAGVFSCGGGTAELVCSGTPTTATYNVQGTNNQVVTIIKTPSNLTNANDGSTLTFTPLGSNSVTLTNSGVPGTDFNIGGSVTVGASTTDGQYTGEVEVTVDYQ